MKFPFYSLKETDTAEFEIPFTFILPFPLHAIDFALPVSMRYQTPPYKHLTSNRYVSPLSRTMFAYEETPPCSCSMVDGCSNDCENFQLSMYHYDVILASCQLTYMNW